MKKVRIWVAASAMAFLLGACGGSGNGNNGGGVAGDAFINSVRSTVATSPDDAEPRTLDNFPAATAPDNTEPEAL